MRRMVAPGLVRLGNRSACMCHLPRAAVNSSSAERPFRRRTTPSGASRRAAIREQRGQWREAAGGHDCGWRKDRRFGADGVDGDVGPGGACGRAQEGAFALIGFDQMDVSSGCDRHHEARKAGTGPQVDDVAMRRQQRRELRRIANVALAERGFVAPRDQIDPAVPVE